MNTLEMLPALPSAALAFAAKNIVRNKHEMDKAARTTRATLLCNELWDYDHSPKLPMEFLAVVVPFLTISAQKEKPIFARVPTALTLGCSWKWGNEHLDEDKAQKIIAQLNSDENLQTGMIDPASYYWVKALGLIAPGEGKNRVDFFRERDISSIPARVTELAYPAADRIKLYKVESGQFSATWAVLDGRWVQPVKHAAWCLPLLQAYGVTLENWPAAYPAPASVQAALMDEQAQRLIRNEPDARPFLTRPHGLIDLDYVRGKEQHEADEIECALSDVETISIKADYLVIAGAACLIPAVGLSMIAALPEVPETLSYVAHGLMVILGAGLAAAAIPMLKIFKIERRHAKSDPAYVHKARRAAVRTGKDTVTTA